MADKLDFSLPQTQKRNHGTGKLLLLMLILCVLTGINLWRTIQNDTNSQNRLPGTRSLSAEQTKAL